jgi:type II secretory pathway pseudopilin PulG
VTNLATRRAGFGLLEVMFAVVITVTALLALQAVVSGGILSAANSVNRRAAREMCRTKLEEILAGLETPNGSGTVEDWESFRWSASSEDVPVGAPEAQNEMVTVVSVEFTFPIETNQEDGDGTETIRLSAAMPPPDGAAAAPAAPGGF